MGLFDIFKKKKPVKVSEPKSAPKIKKTEKELATEKDEPWVGILSMDIDPENLHQGAFELDWNDKFVTNLVRAGYKGKDDAQMVDQWFQDVCRNVVMETFEQQEANNPRSVGAVQRKNIGGGRSEVS
jgi:hypothetical protein